VRDSHVRTICPSIRKKGQQKEEQKLGDSIKGEASNPLFIYREKNLAIREGR
jgi:hypothetical protein